MLPDYLAKSSLSDLSPRIDISVRAYHVCERYDLLMVKDLIAFYNREGGFLRLRNAGRKTTLELEHLCQWLLSQPDTDFDETLLADEQVQYLTWVKEVAPPNLSPRQLDLLNTYVRQGCAALSARSQTALNHLTMGCLDYSTFHRFFFERQIQADQIRNVGKKSFQEINTFIERLRIKVEQVKQQPDEELESVLFADTLRQAFGLPPELTESYLPGIQDRQFLLFRFLHDLLLNHHFLGKRQVHILRARSGWFKSGEEMNMNALGDQVSLTRERVRQIALKTKEIFVQKITFLNTEKTALFHITGGGYGLDIHRDLLLVRKHLADDINHIEGTDFTPRFFAVVFSALHADTHTLFGQQFDFFQNEYLLHRDLMEGFDAEAFVTDIDHLTSERINEDFSIDLEGYLLKFVRPGQSASMLRRAQNVCSDLLLLEFSEKVRLELHSELIICRNTKQHVWEYAFEALESIGGPAKLEIIYQTVVDRHPDFEPSMEALRGTLIKEKSHFISFSRTSTFGLARWEAEREDIRGGTIRDIAEEYLLKCDAPRHYYDIAEYVLRYRPNTSPISIHGNFQLDMSGRFTHFGHGFWGLAERAYGNFRVDVMPKQTLAYLKVWLAVYPDGSVEEAIEHLSKRCQVQPVQIRAWLAEKARSGTLRLEQDKLTIIR